MGKLVEIITATSDAIRNQSLDKVCRAMSYEQLLEECQSLEDMRHTNDNLYGKVRALFFLYAIHRFHIPFRPEIAEKSLIPYLVSEHILNRRFEEAIDTLKERQKRLGPSLGLSSALAEAYKKLAFQTLADQVRKSVRSIKGNQWMFRIGHPSDHPLRIKKELFRTEKTELYPLLHETTPVRMDISHSGWSDIFFLGMDYPEGAKVLNISIDLCIQNSQVDQKPKPPVESFFRIIDEPVLRLTSVDLGATVDITRLSEVFDFAKDYLGLLKAAIIASGLVPSAMEGVDIPITQVLSQLVGHDMGIELVSQVNGIPKGSRLAVSTNLLASLIAICMRASGQTKAIIGQLTEDERRLVAARAILGEWLGGSGGGWQDSGGVWPGIKLIQGVVAGETDPEFTISKGRLLPNHSILEQDQVDEQARKKLQNSLVLVHGGMAQDVGPILEMVTEKYLLRSEREWESRQEAIKIYDILVEKLKKGDIKGLGEFTQKNFYGPIQSIIPWATNKYTELLISRVKEKFGDDFWGFWMLGGMAGGGMGFIFKPEKKADGQIFLKSLMLALKKELEDSVPFAMDPVVYDFAINESGTHASLKQNDEALLPTGYYAIRVPRILKNEMQKIPISTRQELEQLGVACKTKTEYASFVATLFDRMIPQAQTAKSHGHSLQRLLEEHGFDPVFHNQIKADLKNGRVGLSQNRLPVNDKITDVTPKDVIIPTVAELNSYYTIGQKAIKSGQLAIVSLAGGAGSRWTKGAGVVKSLTPYAKIQGKHRNFLETHLAKNSKISMECESWIPHVFTTSYLTDKAIKNSLDRWKYYDFPGSVYISEGKTIGLRFVPMARDLRFEWEEMPQQLLDEQQQKMRESLQNALINWAEQTGEGTDYTDNVPHQCVHPVGHWYEVPNMLLNGTLASMLHNHPQLKYLLVHNIDTLGANADPALLGLHIENGAAITTEVISRNLDDKGGGLANVNGKVRLVEGLALPDEKIEFELSYYNTGTMWIDIDLLLFSFNLDREKIADKSLVKEEVRNMARRMPSYITIKNVKKRWGKGQEDIYPVAQFEKLWGDITALSELQCKYVAVPRVRGQQLKEVAQLDGWLRDGSAAYLESICAWPNQV
jgi:hypothetical protein